MAPLPHVLIASPVRYRPECPEVLGDFFAGIAAQDYRGAVSKWLILQDEIGKPPKVPADWDVCRVDLAAREDSRYLGGPRSTGETQENLAYLRNYILRRFQESKAELLLMVDSDVVLAPTALARMVEAHKTASYVSRCTLSLQIDNRVCESDPPATNAMIAVPPIGECAEMMGRPPRVDWKPVPFGVDGSIVEVHRSGACTLYPRSVLERRFRWDPRYNEEHQGFFDDLRELGFKHWLLQDPSLADHRMKREPDPRKAIRAARAKWEAEHGPG